jgi:hypothetical protein
MKYATGCDTIAPCHRANNSIGGTSQITCGKSSYSMDATNTCTTCPAGSKCTSRAAPSPGMYGVISSPALLAAHSLTKFDMDMQSGSQHNRMPSSTLSSQCKPIMRHNIGQWGKGLLPKRKPCTPTAPAPPLPPGFQRMSWGLSRDVPDSVPASAPDLSTIECPSSSISISPALLRTRDEPRALLSLSSPRPPRPLDALLPPRRAGGGCGRGLIGGEIFGLASS